MLAPPDARLPVGERHRPAPVDDAGAQHLRHQIENARTAQAHRRLVVHRLDLHSSIADEHLFNRARRGAHAIANVRPFEGRARRRGARQMPAPRYQADLGIRANVHGQRHAPVLVQAGGQQHGHMVSAHKTGDVGQQVHGRAGRQAKAHSRAKGYRARRSRRRRRAPAPAASPAAPGTSGAWRCCPPPRHPRCPACRGRSGRKGRGPGRSSASTMAVRNCSPPSA